MGYAIASGHIATTQAAEEVLRAGGNAVDAAIAAFTVAWVAEPCMASAGGGGFAITRVNGDPVLLFDFFCQTPRIKKPAEESDFFPIVVDFGATRETFHVGLGATAVPGAIAGVFALHERYGRMPIRELLQPAIEAAAHGVEINRFQYEGARLLESILRLHPRGRTLFLRNDRLAAVGEICPALVERGDHQLVVIAHDPAEELVHRGEHLWHREAGTGQGRPGLGARLAKLAERAAASHGKLVEVERVRLAGDRREPFADLGPHLERRPGVLGRFEGRSSELGNVAKDLLEATVSG